MIPLGATTTEGQQIEENVQFGPVAPSNIALDTTTILYGVGVLAALYVAYNYMYGEE